MFKRYKCPDGVGWLGYFVDEYDNVTAFVGLDKKVFFIEQFNKTC